MKRAAMLCAIAVVLGGCATQDPAQIVDAGWRGGASQATATRASAGESMPDDAVCSQVRQQLDGCVRERDIALRQLNAEQEGRRASERKLAERDDQLRRCESELAALRQEARADEATCEAMRQELKKHAEAKERQARQSQRMRELEKGLRERLRGELGSRDVEIEHLRSQLTVRVLDRILFDTGSAEILPRGREVLDQVAAALAGGDETIRIEGHADSVPIGRTLKSKYYSNWELSTGRSSSVVRYFESAHGIDPTRMEAVGYSKYRPIATNDTEENRQRNRRVEIVLTPWKHEAGEPVGP